MRTREEALVYGLSFPGTYQEAPFHDPNWQLVRVQGSKKAFLWTYEMEKVNEQENVAEKYPKKVFELQTILRLTFSSGSSLGEGNDQYSAIW